MKRDERNGKTLKGNLQKVNLKEKSNFSQLDMLDIPVHTPVPTPAPTLVPTLLANSNQLIQFKKLSLSRGFLLPTTALDPNLVAAGTDERRLMEKQGEAVHHAEMFTRSFAKIQNIVVIFQ